MSEKLRFDIAFYTIINCDTVKERVESVEADTIEAAKKIAFRKMVDEYPHASSADIFKGGRAFDYEYFYGDITRAEVLFEGVE